MIAAVSPEGDRFGGLQDYVVGNGVPPRAAALARWTNPSKADTAPGRSVPAPPITASAAHPGKKSNNSIVYTRVCSESAARIAGRPGNVTFISKSCSAYGGAGTERRSVMASLGAVNMSLSHRDDGRTTMSKAGGGSLKDPFTGMWSLRELNEWRLDGVVLGNPALVNAYPTSDLIDGRLVATEDINVCIQGPASTLNVFQPEVGFDQRIAPLDELFVGLFATEHKEHWSFRYHPFAVQALREPERNMLRGLGTLVGAWCLGKVLDVAASVGGWGAKSGKEERRLVVNVCVEWLSVARQMSEHPVDLEGNRCFVPTLGVRYGTDEQEPCPIPKKSTPKPLTIQPELQYAPTRDVQDAAVEDVNAWATDNGTDYEKLAAFVDLVQAGDPPDEKQVDLLFFLQQEWERKYPAAVEYVRTGGSQVLPAFRDWCLLYERLLNLLSGSGAL